MKLLTSFLLFQSQLLWKDLRMSARSSIVESSMLILYEWMRSKVFSYFYLLILSFAKSGFFAYHSETESGKNWDLSDTFVIPWSTHAMHPSFWVQYSLINVNFQCKWFYKLRSISLMKNIGIISFSLRDLGCVEKCKSASRWLTQRYWAIFGLKVNALPVQKRTCVSK